MAAANTPAAAPSAPQSNALGALEPPRPAGRMFPRLVWLGLHVVGLGMLWGSGNMPASTAFGVVIACTAVFYSAAAFRDPGYVPTSLPLQQYLLRLNRKHCCEAH